MKKILKVLFVALAVYAILIMPVGNKKKLYELFPVQEAKMGVLQFKSWFEETWSDVTARWFSEEPEQDK